jgi:DNA-binding transcriptional MerR regulator
MGPPRVGRRPRGPPGLAVADSLRLNVDVKSTADGDLSIGEVAARFGVAAHVLRHWEAVGLLAPRRVGGRRRYTADDTVRVAVILRGKEAGFGLDRLRAVLAADCAEARRAVMAEHLTELDARIERARTARDLLARALDCGHADVADCPHFREFVEGRDAAAARASAEGRGQAPLFAPLRAAGSG